MISAGRTYLGEELPPDLLLHYLNKGQGLVVDVGASAFGSSSVDFRRAQPEDAARVRDILVGSTVHSEQEGGEREFQGVTAGLSASAGKAQECGGLCREAATLEILNAVDLRLENAHGTSTASEGR